MSDAEEDARQKRFLDTRQGEPGSGAVRYAAAMYFFQRGQMSERDLEAYRAESKVDGVSAHQRLIGEIRRYIRTLSFAGKDDVLAGISRWGEGAPREIHPQTVPTLSHLPAALAAMPDRFLAAAIDAATPQLCWITYGYEGQDIGKSFPHSHAYATLIGEHGPFFAEDFDLGLFLIAPGIFYRDHFHKAPELYAPLTGPHGWRFEPGAALEKIEVDVAIWNEPFRPHATLAGHVPFLAVYCWTRDVDEPAQVLFSNDWPQIEN